MPGYISLSGGKIAGMHVWNWQQNVATIRMRNIDTLTFREEKVQEKHTNVDLTTVLAGSY